MLLQRKMVFRPSPSPVVRLPVSVRSVGFCSVSTGYKEHREGRSFVQIFWTVSGTGGFLINGETYEVERDTVFLYFAEEEHDIITTEHWQYYWLTLDNTGLEPFLMTLGVHRLMSGRTCPQDLFEQLMEVVKDPTSESETLSSVVAYQILLKAYAGVSVGSTAESLIAAKCRKLMDDKYTDARLNVQEVADQLGHHRATVFRAFKAQYGVSPVQYLARRRLALALRLLRETEKPVADVAIGCGIPDLAYLGRQVKAATGHSPRAFRKL